MQKHAYTHTTKYIWLFLIFITITLTQRDSSSSSCKVYSLHALKKPCQFKLLKYSFLNTHFKWVHSKPILKCQIHTRYVKSTQSSHKHRCLCLWTRTAECVSVYEICETTSLEDGDNTLLMELNQASPPHTFLDLFKCGKLWHVCSQKETQDCNFVQKQHLYRK